jgi:hypothetical protein
VRNMPGDRSREYRRLASGCLALARQNSDLQARASLLIMAQRWLDLAELAEHNAYNRSLQRLAVQAAIGENLRPYADRHAACRLICLHSSPN